jgi:hypothetical protein
MNYYNYEIFTKDSKGKYTKVNELKVKGIYILQDMLSYNERKVDGEKIRIVKHYNYGTKMNIDIYFNNGYKYTYYDIPCTSGAYINSQELLKGVD